MVNQGEKRVTLNSRTRWQGEFGLCREARGLEDEMQFGTTEVSPWQAHRPVCVPITPILLLPIPPCLPRGCHWD